MNGYQKLKMLRRMKLVKIISTVTAMSMAATSLVIAASADAVSKDYIKGILGNLTKYGIVADAMYASGDFESNFAVNVASISNAAPHYDNAVNKVEVTRTLRITVTNNVSQEDMEGPITASLQLFSSNGTVLQFNGVDNGVINMTFEEGGESKSALLTLPAEYKYDTIKVVPTVAGSLKPDIKITVDEDGNEVTTEKPKTLVINPKEYESVPPAKSQKEQEALFGSCIIVDKLISSGTVFQNNMSVTFGEAFEGRLEKRMANGLYAGWYLDGENITGSANNEDTITVDKNAGAIVDDLFKQIVKASEALANIQFAEEGTPVFYREVGFGDIDEETGKPKAVPGGIDYLQSDHDPYDMITAYQNLKANPDALLIVNVYTHDQDTTINVQGYGLGGGWDVASASRIIYNVIGGGKLTVKDSFAGTLIAPNVSSIEAPSVLLGSVYTRGSFTFYSEQHRAIYDTSDSTSEDFSDSCAFEIKTEQDPDETTTTTTTPTEETSTTTTPDDTTTTTTPPDDTTTTTTNPPDDTTTTTTPPPDDTTTTTTAPPDDTTTTTTTVDETTTTTTTTTTEATTTTVAETTTVATTTTPITTTTTAATTTTPNTTTTPAVTTTTPNTTTTPIVTTTTPNTTTTPVVTTTTPSTTTTTTTTTTEVSEEPEESEATTTPITTTASLTTTSTSEDVSTPEDTTTSEDVSEPETPNEPETTTTIPTTTPPPATTTTEAETEPVGVDEPDVPAGVSSEEVAEPPVSSDEPSEETSVPTIMIPSDDVPLGDLIIIDDDIPLGDLPLNTGVNNSVMMFMIIGGAALTIGVSAQVVTVVLKKSKAK